SAGFALVFTRWPIGHVRSQPTDVRLDPGMHEQLALACERTSRQTSSEQGADRIATYKATVCGIEHPLRNGMGRGKLWTHFAACASGRVAPSARPSAVQVHSPGSWNTPKC